MCDLVILLVHVLGPGAIRCVVAESVLIKQQLLILNRSRQRSPNLRSSSSDCWAVCSLPLPAWSVQPSY